MQRGHVAVGHPVDVAAGTYFDTVVDFGVDGAVPLGLERHYSSASLAAPALETFDAAPSLPFGPGWRAGWQAELRRTLDGFAYVEPKGQRFDVAVPAGVALAPGLRLRSVADTLELQIEDDLRVRVVGYATGRGPHELVFAPRADGIAYDLVAIERTRLARVDVQRDASGQITLFTQTREQRQLLLRWVDGRVSEAHLRISDGSQRLLAAYEYDANGLLRQVRDVDGLAETYTYDGAGRMTEKTARGGTIYTVRYDGKGRCVYVSGADAYQERTLSYDDAAHTTHVRNSHGHVVVYEWNDAGQVVRVVSPLGNTVTTQYDAMGRVAQEILPKGGAVTYEYDALGHRTKRTLPGGVEERYEYDAEHRLVRFGDNGRVLTFAYDAEHNVVAMSDGVTPPWRYEHTPYGERSRIVDPTGAARFLQRDARGNVLVSSSFGGALWQHSYDAFGLRIATVDPRGGVRRIAYDDRCRPVAFVDPLGREVRRVYDAGSNSVSTHTPDGRWESMRFAACRVPMEFADSSGFVTRFHWGTEPGELLAIENTRGERMELQRDVEGRIVAQRTFDGRVLAFEYDQEDVRAFIDASGARTELEHDARGNLVRRVEADGESTYAYDDAGRLLQATTPESSMALAYDERGLCVRETVDGIAVERAFDVLGRPVSLGTSLGDATTFGWTPDTELRTLVRGDLTVGFEHDAIGREVRRHLPVGTFDQGYDLGGQLVFQALRDAGAPAAAPSRVARAYTYDPNGRTTRVSDTLRGDTHFRHDARGNLCAALRPGTSELHTVDGEGNRTVSAYTSGIAEEVMTAAIGRGNRLERLESAFRSLEYEYDTNGCVVRKTTWAQGVRSEWRYTWNTRLQLTAMTTPEGATWRYRYDPFGRRIEKVAPDGRSQRFVWDQNRVLHVLEDGVRVESFAYVPGTTSPVIRETSTVQYALPDASGALSELVSANGAVAGKAAGLWGERAVGPDGTALQPLRSQWHDAESGLHYNVYRYYDPDTGRFLSPDPIGFKGGLNTYVAVVDPLSEADDWGLAWEPRTGQTDFPGGADRSRGGSRETTIPVTNQGGQTVQTQRGSVRNGDGSLTSLRGNTACDRFDSGANASNFDDTTYRPGYTSLNGRETPDAASMHAEMRAMSRSSGGDSEALRQGEGPIVFVISRAPCTRCEVDLPPEAQALANASRREVHVYYPPYEKDKKGKRRPNDRYEPECGG